MPEISKQGDLEKFARNIERDRLQPRYFNCRMCGCEFWANKGEYKFKLSKFGICAPCPTCGTNVVYDHDYYF